MRIIAQCPGCGNISLLPETAADHRMRCEKCHNMFKIPTLDQAPKAVKILKDADSTVYVDSEGNLYG